MEASLNAFPRFNRHDRLVAVPKGRLSVGDPVSPWPSTEGTAEPPEDETVFSRPFGTCSFGRFNPTLKRWSILRLSLRDNGCAKFPKAIEAMRVSISSRNTVSQ